MTIIKQCAHFGFRHSDERTNRYKTRDVVNTVTLSLKALSAIGTLISSSADNTVTFEDLFSNAPTLTLIEFGNWKLGCTTTSQTDLPPQLHLLGAHWRPLHLKLIVSLSQKESCTAEVVTQSWTSVHQG